MSAVIFKTEGFKLFTLREIYNPSQPSTKSLQIANPQQASKDKLKILESGAQKPWETSVLSLEFVQKRFLLLLLSAESSV